MVVTPPDHPFYVHGKGGGGGQFLIYCTRMVFACLCQKQCALWLSEHLKEEMNDFKYLGSILCKHGSMGGEESEIIREYDKRRNSKQLQYCNQ